MYLLFLVQKNISHHSLYIFLHLILVKFCQLSLYFIFTVQINNNIDLYKKIIFFYEKIKSINNKYYTLFIFITFIIVLFYVIIKYKIAIYNIY